MPQTRDLFDNIWTDVTLTKIILDRNKIVTQEINIRKDEVEKEQKDAIRHTAPDEEADRLIADYSLDNHVFQAAVMRSIKTMFEMPVTMDGEHSNEIRLLPPSAIKEVVLTVNNLGQVILA